MSTIKQDPDHELGPAELEVLKVLWENGPSTVREVMNRLHERGRGVAYTTVLTFLTRMEQKRYVISDRGGVAYVYEAAVPRSIVVRSRVRSVVEELFDGRPAPLVAQLFENESFSREDVAELQRLVDHLERKTRNERRNDRRLAGSRSRRRR